MLQELVQTLSKEVKKRLGEEFDPLDDVRVPLRVGVFACGCENEEES